MLRGSCALKVPIEDSWWVKPGRLLASPYPGNPDPKEADRRYRALLTRGIRRFISLQEPNELGRGGKQFPDYRARITELAVIGGHQTNFFHFPVVDLAAPSFDQMKAILAAIDTGLERGETVLIHCWGGHGRTGTVVGCWLREQGYGSDEALARIVELRKHNEFLRSQPSPQTEAQISTVRNWRR